MPYQNYETVIGLEVHVQLGTASKAFCGDAVGFGAAPNTQISPISLGHPGTLPWVNARQVEYAVRLALALGAELQTTNTFDRKNYFYADLPKGYQITQDRHPIARGGFLPIKVGSSWRNIPIDHFHMEEDAGKSIHNLDPAHSLIDLNRAGTPLLEVVTRPELHTGEEVDAFMTAMQQLVRYLGISDGNLEEGSLRCDINISVRLHGATQLGERCEVKNVNSMRFARMAIDYEVKRQIDLLEGGGRIKQQTLNFDPQTGVTTPLRSKEDAHDYRYFPEPDLPPVVLTPAYIAAIQASLPPLPQAVYQRLTEQFQLSDYDATLLGADHLWSNFFFDLMVHTPLSKAAANFIINRIMPVCQEKAWTPAHFPLTMPQLAVLLQLVEEGKISNSMAVQRLFPALLENPTADPLELAQTLNLLQTSSADEIEAWIAVVLADNPAKVQAYRKGKKGLLGFFMGELMKKSKGKVDPKVATQRLEAALGND